MIKFDVDIIIFDCDGVILDSVDIKTRAFAALFQEFGDDVVKAVIAYHLKNGGVSRYEKFRYYYRELLGKEITERQMKRLDRQFNEITFEGLLKAPFIPGAFEFLSENYRKWPLYVASGAPEKELTAIFERRDLSKFFKGIYGSPAPKSEILDRIIVKNGISPGKALMIGDSRNDFEAARKAGTHFLGRGYGAAGYPSIDNLSLLSQYLKHIG